MKKSSSFIFCFSLIVVLISTLSSQSKAADLDGNPDPKCERGACSGSLCCPAACGKCGGRGCSKRNPELGLQCCRGWIRRRKAERPCTSVGPPCKVNKPLKCQGILETPSNSPLPSSAPPTLPTPSVSPVIPNQQVHPNAGKWTNVDRDVNGSPSARHENCFVMAEGRGFLIGGRGTRPVEMFDPIRGRWSKVADMPTQMHHMQCVYHNGLIYIPTSWFGGSPSENNNENMWTFDVNTFKWTRMTGLPSRRRRGGAASVLFDDRIYVLAGNRGGHGPPSTSLGWVDYYDLTRKKWVTNLASLPADHVRDHVGGARVGNKICIAAGRNGGLPNPFAAVVTSTWCYDPNNDSWENMEAPIPAGRAGAATGTLCDGRMVVIGGEGRFSKAFDRVDAFDGRKWKTLNPIVRSRHGTGVAISDCRFCDHLFIAAGSGARGGRPELDSTEEYVPVGSTASCNRY